MLWIISGNVVCYKCLFSFKLLSKSIETNIIGIIIEPHNSAKLVKCEIVGHKTYQCTGVLV